MKPRHAAALALVGWRLMVPPPMPITDTHVVRVIDGTAPLAQWQAILRFEKASDCAAAKRNLEHNAFRIFLGQLDSWNRNKHPQLPTNELRFMQTNDQNMSSECVSSDDPRLTGSSAERYHSAVEGAGWYLMEPPMEPPMKGLNAPLGKWWTFDPFDTAVDCELERQEVSEKAKQAEEARLKTGARIDANPPDQALVVFETERSMRCVSTEDPRLKER